MDTPTGLQDPPAPAPSSSSEDRLACRDSSGSRSAGGAAAERRSAFVRELMARARALPEVRPGAVAAARAALRRGEVDSHAAVAAAVRGLRLGR